MAGKALIIVDVQVGFDDPKWGRRNNPQCEQNIAALVEAWEASGQPIVIIRHDSNEPDSPLRPAVAGNALKDFLRDRGDVVISKVVHSSFHGDPDLAGWLRERDIAEVAICGLTTNHCCETTARVACDLGFAVTFITDATATFDRTSPTGKVIAAEELVEVTATNLAQEFGEVTATADVLRSLAVSAAG
jgi:nicotinamidase-related amidase